MGREYLYTVMVGKCEGRKPFCRHWSTETGNTDTCWKKCGLRVDWMEYLDGGYLGAVVDKTIDLWFI